MGRSSVYSGGVGIQQALAVAPPVIAVKPAVAFSVTYPANVTAGVVNALIITAVDSGGNVVPSYLGTVSFSSSDTGATVPGFLTFTNTNAGLLSTTATLATIGTQTITASDGTISGTATSTVGGGTAVAFTVTYPATTVVGRPNALTITAVDVNGNAVPSYGGTATFTSSDGSAVLPGSHAFAPSDAGTFTTSATLNTTGAQTITASDGVISGNASSTVSGALAANAFKVAYPSSTASGISNAIVISAIDASGNVVTTYTGTATFSSSDGAAVLPGSHTFVSGDNGVFTSVATLNTTGSQTVSVTDGSISGSAASVVGSALPISFTYLGVASMPTTSFRGLTYRASTGTWFAIGNGGNTPYNLYELSIPANGGAASIVKNWGPLNQGGQLNIAGSLVNMRGLLWVSDTILLVNTAEYYINPTNNPALWSFNLTSGSPVLNGGPWYVPATVGAFRVRGNVTLAPTAVANLGYGLAMNSVAQQASGLGSWGLGYVGVTMPTLSTPAGSTLPAIVVIEWPGGQNPTNPFTHSNYPPLPADQPNRTLIKNNDDVSAVRAGKAQGGTSNTIILANDGSFTTQPLPEGTAIGWYVTNQSTGEQILITGWNSSTRVASLASPWTLGIPGIGTPYLCYLATYQTNAFYDVSKFTTSNDLMGPCTAIELLDSGGHVTKSQLFYVGQVGLGYQWYGNAGSHDDETPLGIAGSNDLDSIAFPPGPVTDVNTNRGFHVEKRALRWYLVDPSVVATVAAKVIASTATPADLQVLQTAGGALATLGGSPQYLEPHNNANSGQNVFVRSPSNPATGTLYVLVPAGAANGKSVVLTFQIS
jgi:hypothetical protein